MDISNAIYFITIAASKRDGTELVNHAQEILDSARHRQAIGQWFLHLLLVMPDHLHMLVHINDTSEKPRTLGSTIKNWKHFLSRTTNIAFQRDFFDTRIRDADHFAEKWDYICKNPVAKGLVSSPRLWPYSIAFDPITGNERQHR